MKIALTNIGGSSPGSKPIATSILSAVLKREGHEVALFDSTYMDLEFMKELLSTNLRIKENLYLKLIKYSRTSVL